METSERTPRGGVHAPDLDKVVRADGPFLTLYLDTDPAIEQAAQRSETRWKTVRRDLDSAGVPADVLAEIDGIVPEAHLAGRCLAVVANETGILHVAHGPESPARDLGRWAPLPMLLPLIEWRQSQIPHVAVLADRRGADLIGFRAGHPDLTREAGVPEHTISRANPGGWSQRRFQQRAENSWQDNAESVVRELARLAKQIEARLIVAAGDVRAIQLMREAMPDELTAIFQVIDGGRSPDGSSDEVAAEITRLVSILEDQETAALLTTFEEERGQGDRAADGVSATLAALAMAQVDTLLVADDYEDRRTAWYGPEAAHVAASPEDLARVGVEPVGEARLLDAITRAALGTGAGVRVVAREGAPTDGVGALLRWSAG